MTTNKSLYDRLGGAAALKELVDTFYDIIETDPDGRSLNLLHLRGHGVAHSRIEQFNYLSGFLGGPKLYSEKHGHADVREMHRHVEISMADKDAWLLCMSKAIEKVVPDANVGQELMKYFRVIAIVLEKENSINFKKQIGGRGPVGNAFEQ